MLKKRKAWVVIAGLLATLGSCAYAYYSVVYAKPKSIGQPISTKVLIRNGAATETVRISGQMPSVLLETMFYPPIHKESSALNSTSNPKYTFRFQYPDGETREVQVVAKDEQGEWYFGDGRFAVLGDIELALSLMPLAEARGLARLPNVDADRDCGEKIFAELRDSHIDSLFEWLESENGTFQDYGCRWLQLPRDHPRVAEVRAAALRHILSNLREHHAVVGNSTSTRKDRSYSASRLHAFCELMKHVGTTKEAARLAAVLSAIDSEHCLQLLLTTVEHLYGLPPFHKPY